MKDARFLVRLANPEGRLPREGANLIRRLRSLIEPLQGRAINLRISAFALEFDLFCLPEARDEMLEALKPFGVPLTVKRLDGNPPSPTDEAVIAEVRQLSGEHRFWEVHEVLEGLWKKSEGSEKKLVQALIIAAAALVHFQKDELAVAWRMLEDAVKRLENSPTLYRGLAIASYRQALQAMILSREISFPVLS